MYNLVFYTNTQGDSPIDDFLDSLDNKSRAKVAAHLSLLERARTASEETLCGRRQGKNQGIENATKLESVPYSVFLPLS
ncbi:MAG: hypothetical protein AB2L12_01610 [Smithellaceae bacterium]